MREAHVNTVEGPLLHPFWQDYFRVFFRGLKLVILSEVDVRFAHVNTVEGSLFHPFWQDHFREFSRETASRNAWQHLLY